MHNLFRLVAPVLVMSLAACASRPNDIAPAYVSPIPYQQMTCTQLGQEATRVSQNAAIASGAQNKQATNDAVVTTVGIVVFWPALFFIKGDTTQAAEVSRLKGEMNAIEEASIARKCGIAFQRGTPPKARK